MNTRIQVEHPVTELVMGVDLVQWQLRIARGETLPFTTTPEPNGWAIECRITSEDPANGFLPSTGRITHLQLPAGPGVRWDGGITTGSVVGLSYDPMLAKLIVHAPTRELAIARMERALRELVIDGVETSREFHLRVMADADYRAGNVTIQWLEQKLPQLLGQKPPAATIRAAAIAAALLAERDRGGRPNANANANAGARGGSGSIGASQSGASSAPTTSAWAELARREGLR